jgi:hypothetical protein
MQNAHRLNPADIKARYDRYYAEGLRLSKGNEASARSYADTVHEKLVDRAKDLKGRRGRRVVFAAVSGLVGGAVKGTLGALDGALRSTGLRSSMQQGWTRRPVNGHPEHTVDVPTYARLPGARRTVWTAIIAGTIVALGLTPDHVPIAGWWLERWVDPWTWQNAMLVGAFGNVSYTGITSAIDAAKEGVIAGGKWGVRIANNHFPAPGL